MAEGKRITFGETRVSNFVRKKWDVRGSSPAKAGVARLVERVEVQQKAPQKYP
jgi:hypothetical protein